MKSIRNRFGFVAIGLVTSLAVGGAASAADAPAVQWKVSDGGNGHWYQFVTTIIRWDLAQAEAQLFGGNLVTITSESENNFVRSSILLHAQNAVGYLGGFRDEFGWHWVTGEEWSYSNWNQGEPNGDPGEVVWMQNIPGYPIGWNDCPPTIDLQASIREWSADCNGDGVVDYGQIQSGEFADTNHNGVPDVCDPHVTYVLPISGPASGGTAVNINGMNFPNTVSVLFAGVAATDVVVVSPTLITAVTPVGVPGMTVVTVNGVGGEAFYYRSNCQSDLDGSGGVDSSDLGILLLDFGSCDDSAAVAPQQPEPFILQSIETTTHVLNKK